jgi:hypothetical protein
MNHHAQAAPVVLLHLALHADGLFLVLQAAPVALQVIALDVADLLQKVDGDRRPWPRRG